MHTDFLRLAGISVPAAYGIKMYLQYFFGRTNIRTWLSGGGTLDFVWFTPLSQHPCFPSGHMTVVTSFVTAVWIYYPRWRLFSGVALISLAAALLLTNYHFLGDVIAGFYCGMCVTLIVRNILSYLHRDIQHTNFTD
jgi:membrane-associated phospholipid phosphatase